MSPESALSEEQVAHCIQLCLSEDEVPDEELRTLNDLMKTNSDKAKDIAVRILDENMIRNWFRSEADTVFINEVQKRLNIRFRDSEFISAVMTKVHEGLDATVGDGGDSVVKDEVKSVSMLKYILVPIVAFIAYVGLFHSDQIKTFFVDADSFIMTVDDFKGQPTVISENKRKTALLKMVIRPGDTLNTGTGQSMKLKYPDHTGIEVRENSNAVIVESESRKEIQLLRGGLKISTTPQHEPMTIHTTFGIIKIKEGMAEISLSETSDAVQVLSGSVIIEHATSDIVKNATPGKSFSLSNEGMEEVTAITDKKEKRELTNE